MRMICMYSSVGGDEACEGSFLSNLSGLAICFCLSLPVIYFFNSLRVTEENKSNSPTIPGMYNIPLTNSADSLFFSGQAYLLNLIV